MESGIEIGIPVQVWDGVPLSYHSCTYVLIFKKVFLRDVIYRCAGCALHKGASSPWQDSHHIPHTLVHNGGFHADGSKQ